MLNDFHHAPCVQNGQGDRDHKVRWLRVAVDCHATNSSIMETRIRMRNGVIRSVKYIRSAVFVSALHTVLSSGNVLLGRID